MSKYSDGHSGSSSSRPSKVPDIIATDLVVNAHENFVRTHQKIMAASVMHGTGRRRMPSLLDENHLFTQASAFGDSKNLYHQGPSNRIGTYLTFATANIVASDLEASLSKRSTLHPIRVTVPPSSDMMSLPRLDPIPKDKSTLYRSFYEERKQGVLHRNSALESPTLAMSMRRAAETIAHHELAGNDIDKGTADHDMRMSVQDAIFKYFYYIENGVLTSDIAPYKDSWRSNIMSMLPDSVPTDVSPEFIENLISETESEMEAEYFNAVRKSIIDYVMLLPDEARRLGLSELVPFLRELSERTKFLSTGNILPLSWLEAVDIARDHLAQHLQTLSINCLELEELWYRGGFNSGFLTRVNDEDFKNELPVSLEYFSRTNVGLQHERTNMLWNAWFPGVVQVFRLIPAVYAGGNVDSYYRSVTTQLSNQLRKLVADSVHQITNFFEEYSDIPVIIDPFGTDQLWDGVAAFKISASATENGIIFDPPLLEFKQVCKDVIENVARSTHGFPRVDAELFEQKKTDAIPSTGIDEVLVRKTVARVCQIFDINESGPNILVELFRDYLPLLTFDLKGELQIYFEEEHELDDYRDRIEHYRSISSKIEQLASNQVRSGIFEVDLTLVKVALSDRAKEISNSYLDQVLVKARSLHRRLISQYATMSKGVMKKPTNEEEAVKLKNYIKEVKVEIDNLNQDILLNQSREAFLESYFYTCSDEDVQLAWETYAWPKKLMDVLTMARRKADDEYKSYEQATKQERVHFSELLQSLDERVAIVKEYGDINAVDNCSVEVRDLSNAIESALEQAELINSKEVLFGWAKTKYSSTIPAILGALDPYLRLWSTAKDFKDACEDWLHEPFTSLNPEDIDEKVNDWWRVCYKLSKSLADQPGPLSVAELTREKIDNFKLNLPLISAVCNAGLRDRHWDSISETVGFKVSADTKTPLQRLLTLRCLDHVQKLGEISDSASREYNLEKNLAKMKSEWVGVEFEFKEWKATGTYILGSGPVEEVQTLLDDHIVKSQAMVASPYAEPFRDEVIEWEQKLNSMQDIIDVLLKVQSKWLYLEPIFGSPEMMRQMPTEGGLFQKMNRTWHRLMAQSIDIKLVLSVSGITGMLSDLTSACSALETIERGLNEFLEGKQRSFPRFYFLANEELLEILAEAKDPLKIQPFMRKCFEGIKELSFQDNLDITAMVSPEGEVVSFHKGVNPRQVDGGAVELWLNEVQATMQESLRVIASKAIAAYLGKPRSEWILDWPGMLVLCCSQIYWTKEVSESIQGGRVQEYSETCTSELRKVVELVRGDLTKLERATISALVVVDVHARDTVQILADVGVQSETEFSWQSQLRYYWESETIVVKMINASAVYGYEYLGNTGRLVITPLTDRCYRTLMGAIYLNLGGAPAGPAGTGKTETTKDLAKAIAINCIVFNCSDGLDYKAMGKFFKGLASAGAWACFDEFNRIELEVLSVVAQQVLTIQRAVAAKLDRFVFEGIELKLVHTCNAFITMNPGYAGRSELPDNLKALFRDVAMMVPDYALISEIILYSNGYFEARDMARKLVQTYRLCSEQLSKQDHYDYGMRAVIAVLRAAGNLKRQYGESLSEDILVLRAIKDVNLPKFLDFDVPLFEGILSDLFPGVELPVADYEKLTIALNENCSRQNLQPLPTFFEKIIQLYEMIIVRHGLMIVGASYGMKSSMWSVLQGALGDLHSRGENNEQSTKIFPLNPKSISMGELYGESDLLTNEWSDGVLAVLFRNCCRDTGPERKWIMFDGPVDAIWIENMNTVLDDNKKLCLNSGEIIAMQGLMNIIFEVQDLAVASPATVSRCGMVYTQAELLGWRPVVLSWLNRLPEPLVSRPKVREQLLSLFDWLLPPALRCVTKDLSMLCPVQDINLVESLCKMFDCLIHALHNESFVADLGDDILTRWIDGYFLFCFVWTVGGNLSSESQEKFERVVREFTVGKCPAEYQPFMKISAARKLSLNLPDDGLSIYNVALDTTTSKEKPKWVSWFETAPKFSISDDAEYTQILVQTVDTVRYSYLTDILTRNGESMLLCGPTGTGKSVYVKRYLATMDVNLFDYTSFTFSAQTSAKQTQKVVDGKLDKRRKGVYGPAQGKKSIFFIDDLNMPQVEVYGAQPPIELLRQFMDYSGWYDTGENSFRRLVDVQFISAMGPAGGGRNSVTNRYLRHFVVQGINEFDAKTMTLIFSTLVDWWLKRCEYGPAILRLKDPMVAASIDVYYSAQRELLPTPIKSHYTFNLRDLSKLFQGVQSASTTVDDPGELMRLWTHETLRVFHDRLIDDEDRRWVVDCIKLMIENHFGDKFEKVMGRFDTDGDSNVSLDELRHLMFGDYMIPGADPQLYDEVTDNEKLITVMNEYLSDYNAVSKKPMPLVLFLFAIEHVSRICRIIKQPGGHALLVGVGGSGRQSLTRLASYIEEYEVFGIEISKTYGTVEWRDDLKTVIRMAGEQDKRVVFLFNDTQIITESFIEDISNLLNTGEVPNLFEAGDLVAIFENIGARAKQAKMNGSKAELYNFFISEVRKNLHIVLAFSPIGSAFRDRLRRFPSIVNCCTIDWFSAWPADALSAVASRFLADLNVPDSVRPSLSALCVEFHQTSKDLSQQYLEESRRHFYITPITYIELIRSFESLLGKKQTEVMQLKNRYETGIEKLLSTEAQVSQMQIELTNLQPQLVIASKETEEMMVVIEKETIEANKVKEVVSADEAVASKQAEAANSIRVDCEKDLAEALPALNAAEKALETLSPKDIQEAKALANPPYGVKLVMETVCIMLEIKPERMKDKDGKMINDLWKPSQKLLGDKDFLMYLKNYDKDNIKPALLDQIKNNYYDDENFQPDRVLKVSKACHGLCCWVRAMVLYDKCAKIVGPKKAQLAEADAELAVVMEKLGEKQATLKKVVDNLNLLDAQLKEAVQKKANLEAEAELCAQKLDRATKLIAGLGGEKSRWTDNASSLGEQYIRLTGDVLIASAYASYLGPFTATYRSKVSKLWVERAIELDVPCSSTLSFIKVLGDPVAIRDWNINGLPRDDFSSENGIIMSVGRRWPYCIDPQGQTNKWIRNMESSNGLKVCKLSDSNYMRTIENAIQFGNPVLLENVGEELDASLEPLLLKQLFKQGGAMCLKLGDSIVEYHDDFKLYITTKLRNPHLLPELCAKISLLNFMITPEGLEDQLLGIVVAKERPDLEEEKSRLILQGAQNKRQLQEIEDKILFILSSSEGNILEDEGAVATLGESKVLSNDIAEKQMIADETEKQIDETRIGYRPVAKHATMLFFALSDLSDIEVVYKYSMPWFVDKFTRSIDNSAQSDDIQLRMSSLNDYFTYFLYENVERSLFEKDKLLFSFMLASRILISAGKVDPEELRFLLVGGVVAGELPANPAKRWMSDKVWAEFNALSTLSNFSGLADSVKGSVGAWKSIYDSAEPYLESIPEPWDRKTSEFQKLLLLRCLRPDKLTTGLLRFVGSTLGPKFIDPKAFNIYPSFKESNSNIPLLFILSAGSDPMASLLKFAEIRSNMKVETVSLGQGQGPIAQKLIESGAHGGYWVVLQNCHLAKSFMPVLEKICETQLVPEKIHRDFRLWMTSYPTDLLPVSVVENSVKMTNEAPEGLRAGLMRVYNSDPVNDPSFFSQCNKPELWSRMLYALAFFHASIIERKKFGALGWNIPYEFNENDLRICVRQLQIFLNEADGDIPLDTLQYTCGECNYGGKVTDGQDRVTMQCLLSGFYCKELVDDPSYKFSESGKYVSITLDNFEDYLAHIESLPLSVEPEVFGLHNNADITKDLRASNLLLDALLLTQPRSGGSMDSGGKSEDDVLFDLADELLSSLPSHFDIEAATHKYPVDYYDSMNTVLCQELGRVNDLLTVIRSSLSNLKKAVKGLILMSSSLENAGKSMLLGKVPEIWLKKSFPSLKPLTSYFKEVIDRVHFFHGWLSAGKPVVFWLSGFFFTQAFLTGARQNFARKRKVAIDSIVFDFFIRDLKSDCSTPPEDGVYCNGLYFDGCAWDYEEHVLGESKPKVLFSEVPKIHFLPVQSENVHQFNNYDCPLYKTSDRRGILSTTGHSTNHIMNVNLPSSVAGEHWTRRGVAMLTCLDS